MKAGEIVRKWQEEKKKRNTILGLPPEKRKKKNPLRKERQKNKTPW
jgi:hypothetical protein